MAEVACNTVGYKREALYWDDESRNTEEAVRRSAKNEEILSRMEKKFNELIVGCLRHEEEFRLWEAGVDSEWATDPACYDEELHTAIQDISGKWFIIFRRCVNFLDSVEGFGLGMPRAAKLRDRYATMISVEEMDHGLIPDFLIKGAAKALGDYKSGRTKELDL